MGPGGCGRACTGSHRHQSPHASGGAASPSLHPAGRSRYRDPRRPRRWVCTTTRPGRGTYPVRLARAMVLDNVTRPLARLVADPLVRGVDGLTGLESPVIFAANHVSHVDTPLLLTCLPLRFRHRTVVAAAADYFFDRRWKSDAFSLPARRDPRRAVKGQPPLGRPRRRPGRGRLEPGHLPRGRSLPRRVGAAVPRRRRLPGGPHRPADRAGPPRRNPMDAAEGPFDDPTDEDDGHLRHAA